MKKGMSKLLSALLIATLVFTSAGVAFADTGGSEYGIPPCTSYGCVTSNTPETLQPRAFVGVPLITECSLVQRVFY